MLRRRLRALLRDRPAAPRRTTAPRKGPLSGLESLVPAGPGRVVVIVAHHTQRAAVRRWLRAFSRDRVFVVAPVAPPEWGLDDGDATFLPAGSVGGILGQVRLVGPVDVLVTLLSGPLLPEGAADQLAMFRSLFRHVRPKGVYVLDRSCIPLDETTDLRSWLDLLSVADDPDQAALAGLERELARSTASVAVTRDVVLATKRLHHLVMLRDAQVDRLLTAREPAMGVEELGRLHPGDLRCRATVTSHNPSREIEHLPAVLPYPELYLRHYTGKIALAGRTLMYSGSTILPDSFRWHLSSRPTNPLLVAQWGDCARVPRAAVPRRELDGSYYQLDCAFPGHFGHLTTEVASRLWGWDEAKSRIPALKAILTRPANTWRTPALDLAVLTAYGIPEEDIVWVDEPVWLRSVVSASPMWHNEHPHYVHPDIRLVWERLSAGLSRGLQTPWEGPRRLFVSRRSQRGARDCRNAREVEDLFGRHGFRVVYPELHSLAEQVSMFAQAEVVAGLAGSGLFNLMHAREVKTVIVLSHEAYLARNEHLFTSILGPDVHYFWSKPDIEHPPDERSQSAYQSPWEFDFARNGAELEHLLQSL